MSEKKVDRLVTVLNKMVDEADGCHEVTMDMLMRRGRVKVCRRVIANALHARGFYFRNLREKPILTPEDVEQRFRWASKYRGKSAAWWLKAVHLHLDNHVFKVATTSAGRKLLAKRVVRGVYRKKGMSLRPGHVKPNAALRLGLGVKGVLKAGGVGGGKVLVWDTIEKRWSGAVAAELYTDVIKPALQSNYGEKRRYCILEDNDPTGNLSNAAKRAKVAAQIEVLSLPKRSPELNVMDFAVWSEVERRLRAQEKKWPSTKHETRADFMRRVDRVARSIPKEFIDKSISDLPRRCERSYQAKGGLFEEGGRHRRPL